MDTILSYIFLLLSFLSDTPKVKINWVKETNWRLAQDWKPLDQNTIQFKTVGTNECANLKTNNRYFVTPGMVQTKQQLHGKIGTGNWELVTKSNPVQFYDYLHVNCTAVNKYSELQWTVETETHSLATIGHLPKSVSTTKAAILYLFRVELNRVVSGVLILLSLITIILFHKKVSPKVTITLVITSLLYSITLFIYAPFFDFINLHSLLLQKIADSTLWCASMGTFYLMQQQGYSSIKLFKLIRASCITSIILIFFSRNMDELQIGSNISLILTISVMLVLMFQSLVKIKQSKKTEVRDWFKLLIVFSFVIPGINDLLSAISIINTVPLMPIASLSSLGLISLSVNNDINQTYKERDYLQKNLEKEVELKTKSLEEALQSLKLAQADLIQSANLAGLGTLSAGIAHEINNSLNYVNGSLLPLQNAIKRINPPENEKKKIDTLLDLMKEGLTLTFDIIKNLKKQASTASQSIEKLHLKHEIDGICLLLKGRIPSSFKIESKISEDLHIYLSRTSLSQILMNLVINASDALEDAKIENAKILVEVSLINDNQWQLIVRDNGPGIPEDIQQRIFEPFFTTKEVGRGTGLGLHIVRNEIQNNKGTLKLNSKIGEGTEFVIELPVTDESNKANKEAA